MANTPILRINGNEVPFWSDVSIDRSFESIADQFTVSYAMHDGVPEALSAPLTFDGDEEVELTLDGEPVLTGWVDAPSVEATAEGTSVTITGYSKTADLQVCPMLPGTKRWKQRSIQDIVIDICEPLSITVEVGDGAEEAAATKLENFKVEFGDLRSDAIMRACEFVGLVAHASPDGSLLLSRIGGERTSTELRHGLNVKSVSVSRDARDRFSHYYIVGSGASGFSDDDLDVDKGKAAVVVDLGVGRYRPTILNPETDVKKQRARIAQGEWERNRRAAMSLQLSVTLIDWQHESGIWSPGLIVPFASDKFGIGGDFVISTVSLSRRPDGSEVRLELLRQAALDPRVKPLPRRRRAPLDTTDYGQGEDEWHIEQTKFYQDHPELADQGETDVEYDDTELEPFG